MIRTYCSSLCVFVCVCVCVCALECVCVIEGVCEHTLEEHTNEHCSDNEQNNRLNIWIWASLRISKEKPWISDNQLVAPGPNPAHWTDLKCYFTIWKIHEAFSRNEMEFCLIIQDPERTTPDRPSIISAFPCSRLFLSTEDILSSAVTGVSWEKASGMIALIQVLRSFILRGEAVTNSQVIRQEV